MDWILEMQHSIHSLDASVDFFGTRKVLPWLLWDAVLVVACHVGLVLASGRHRPGTRVDTRRMAASHQLNSVRPHVLTFCSTFWTLQERFGNVL